MGLTRDIVVSRIGTIFRKFRPLRGEKIGKSAIFHYLKNKLASNGAVTFSRSNPLWTTLIELDQELARRSTSYLSMKVFHQKTSSV